MALLGFELLPDDRVESTSPTQLNVENSLDIVPGATHLFEEPGTLEQVADLAINWFVGLYRLYQLGIAFAIFHTGRWQWYRIR